MPDRPTAERTARLLLRYFRDPSRFRAEALQPDAPPLDCGLVLKLALGHSFDFAEPALNRLGPTVLREAAASYVRRMFLRAEATPYQTLGVAPEASPEAIKDHFRLVMQLVHPDRQDPRLRWPESCAAQANRAYGILKNEASRAEFDRDEAERARAALAQAALAQAAHGAARPPTVGGRRWPDDGHDPRRRPQEALLPPWLTEGVGGFVRRHPAAVAFSTLIGGAALVVAATVWDGQAGSLTRDQRQASAPARSSLAASAPAMAPMPVATPAATPVATAVVTPAATPVVAPVAIPATSANAVPAPVVAMPERRPVNDAPAAPRTGAPAIGANAPAAGSTVALASPALPVTVPTVAAPTTAAAPTPRTVPVTPAVAPVTEPQVPTTAEIEALFAAFVESYDRGRLDAFTALFDDDAESNLHRGRAAIRGEYDELFRLSSWRRMQLTRINWKRAGERAYAKGEIAVKIGWRDGREVDQRIAVDMEMAHRDGRLVITRLSHQPRNP